MRLDQAPGNNPDFVLGMKHLFDREQMKKSVFRGFAEMANDQPIAPSNRYYSPTSRSVPTIRTRRSSICRRPGLRTRRCRSWRRRRPNSVEMAVVLQQAAQKIGLNIDVKRVPADGYWSNYWMKDPVGFGNVNPRPSADILFYAVLQVRRALERVRLEEREVRPAPGRRARRDRRGQAQADVRRHADADPREAGIGIPVFITSLDGHSSQAEGPAADPARRPDGLRLRRVRLARRLIHPFRQSDAAAGTGRRPAMESTMNAVIWKLLLARLALRRYARSSPSSSSSITAMLPGDVAQEILGQAATPEAVAALRSAMGLDAAGAAALPALARRAADRRSRHVAGQRPAGRRR